MKCRKYRPSKAEAATFAQKMAEINDFCYENGIYSSYNNDSYYFTIDGQEYCVSSHGADASNSEAYDDERNRIRDFYHEDGRKSNVKYIYANKTRIIEIYLDLKAGHKIDRRGYRID